MTEAELRQLVAQNEGTWLEFKERTSGGLVRDSEKTAAAFSTSGSGRILFGVRDDGTITGQQVSDQTIRELANAYRAAVQPTINPLIERVPIGGVNEVIVVSVALGQVGPYRRNGVAYERSGSTNQRMSEERFQQLLLERLHGTARWENTPLDDWTVDDLDASEIVRTLEAGIDRNRLTDPGTRNPEALLESFHLLRDGKLLRAAAVLFGRADKLAELFPQCQLKQAVMEGNDPGGSTFRDLRPPLHGNLFQLYEAGQRFIIDHSPTVARIVTTDGIAAREDTPMYPPDAVREALANALCHRDYSSGGGAVTIRLFDDRLEIFSAGSLHFGLTRERLFSHHDSHPWNPLLADALYDRGIIDAFGTGIGRMRSAMTDAGLPEPDIEDADGSVLVTLSASVAGESRETAGTGQQQVVSPDQRAASLIALAREMGRFKLEDAASRLGTSKRTARRAIVQLVAGNELEEHGTTSTREFSLPGH